MNDTLKEGEPHPAIDSAIEYFRTIPLQELFGFQESFSSCAIEGNRLAQICAGTLRRIMNKEPVSDRYLLGLVWAIKEMREKENEGKI